MSSGEISKKRELGKAPVGLGADRERKGALESVLVVTEQGTAALKALPHHCWQPGRFGAVRGAFLWDETLVIHLEQG